MSAQSGVQTRMVLDACGLDSSYDDYPDGEEKEHAHWQRNIENPLEKNTYEFIYFEGNETYEVQAAKFCKELIDNGKKIIVPCTKKEQMLIIKDVFLKTYPDLDIGFVHGSMNQSEKTRAIDLARTKPHDIFFHSPTISSGVSLEFVNMRGYDQVVVFLSDKSIDANGVMQMTGRARKLEKQDGRPGGLVLFLCDQAMRDWDFRPGYQHTRRVTEGDRLNDESPLNDEIDACQSVSKVLQFLLTNGEDTDYSW